MAKIAALYISLKVDTRYKAVCHYHLFMVGTTTYNCTIVTDTHDDVARGSITPEILINYLKFVQIKALNRILRTQQWIFK